MNNDKWLFIGVHFLRRKKKMNRAHMFPIKALKYFTVNRNFLPLFHAWKRILHESEVWRFCYFSPFGVQSRTQISRGKREGRISLLKCTTEWDLGARLLHLILTEHNFHFQTGTGSWQSKRDERTYSRKIRQKFWRSFGNWRGMLNSSDNA